MRRQCGVVLIVSLVFLLLLSLLAVSSMQNATLQEKMAGSQKLRSESFQNAESLLRIAQAELQAPGFRLSRCSTVATCAPPEVSKTLQAGSGSASGVTWITSADGLYAIQYFADTEFPVNTPQLPASQSRPLYRITAIGLRSNSRTVLESVHTLERRIAWRQRD